MVQQIAAREMRWITHPLQPMSSLLRSTRRKRDGRPHDLPLRSLFYLPSATCRSAAAPTGERIDTCDACDACDACGQCHAGHAVAADLDSCPPAGQGVLLMAAAPVLPVAFFLTAPWCSACVAVTASSAWPVRGCHRSFWHDDPFFWAHLVKRESRAA